MGFTAPYFFAYSVRVGIKFYEIFMRKSELFSLSIEETVLLKYNLKSKNLARYRSENDFVELSGQNNYVGRSSLLEYQNFLLRCVPNYFDGLTKLFSDLYLAKFLNMIF